MSTTLCNVQQKMSCLFETVIVNEPSSKRPNQAFKIVAGETLKTSALDAGLETAVASEKLDGTCVLVEEFNGKPWLWARHDRKPTKAADKRFKKFQNVKSKMKDDNKETSASDATGTANPTQDHKPDQSNHVDNGKATKPDMAFPWDLAKDFKDVPDHWTPATGVPIIDGITQPDSNGHIPGWVPVDPKSRQHCWHLSVVDLELGLGIVLQPKQRNISGSGDDHVGIELEINAKPLAELKGCTLELIGTNVNNNPYFLGDKYNPLHVLVRHGIIPFAEPPPIDYLGVRAWFQEEDGQVEGAVWHCHNGKMFKLHRHHLQQKWPVERPRILSFPVSISLSGCEPNPGTQFHALHKQYGRVFNSMMDIRCMKCDENM